jgi:uncharacterized protein YdaU (DUF1376 family)
MAASPFMPLYIADYMADTAHLTTVEHGAYLLLIMTYWQRGEALPDDDKKLARIAGMQGRNWKRVRAELEPFFTFRDGKWVHQRIEMQLAVMRSQSRANSLNAKKRGQANASKSLSENEANAKRNLSHTDTDTDTYNSVSKDTGASADPDKLFWDMATAYLGAKNRGLIGRWIKDYTRPRVAEAIAAAQVERAVEPIAYITATLRRKGRHGSDDEMTMPC